MTASLLHPGTGFLETRLPFIKIYEIGCWRRLSEKDGRGRRNILKELLSLDVMSKIKQTKQTNKFNQRL